MANALNLFPSRVAFVEPGPGTSGLLTREAVQALRDLVARLGGPNGTVVNSLQAPPAGITVTPTSGAVVLALADDLAALEALATNGLIARVADGTMAARTFNGTVGEISVTDGDGVSGNPLIGLAASVGFSAWQSAPQAIPPSSTVLILCDTLTYQSGAAYYDAVLGRWTPPAGRIVTMSATVALLAVTDQKTVTIEIRKNGAPWKFGNVLISAQVGGGNLYPTVTAQDLPNGTDYYEVFAGHNDTGAINTGAASSRVWFQGARL